jgi:microcystin-dependent protein
MKNNNLIKSSGVLLMAMAIVGGFIFFTSASTKKQSNSQSIAELSAKLSQMTTELNDLKTTECEEEVWMEPTLGQVAMFAGNFAPRGWAFCNGQILSISQNSALFSLLGTTYGGDGRTTFGLPDLRGRVPVHVGQGPGLSNVSLGRKFGQETMSIIPQTASVASSSDGNEVMLVSGILPNVNAMQPSMGINFIIATTGLFPSRS